MTTLGKGEVVIGIVMPSLSRSNAANFERQDVKSFMLA